MNKIFSIIMILISLLNLLYFNLKDVLTFPQTEPAEYTFLKEFNSEFKDLKEVGFYSDEEDPISIKYRIQNSIMPAFLKSSINTDYVFCYSLNGHCNYFVESKQADLVKKYTDDLFLIKKPEIRE